MPCTQSELWTGKKPHSLKIVCLVLFREQELFQRGKEEARLCRRFADKTRTTKTCSWTSKGYQ